MAIPDDIAEALVSAHERMDAQFKRIEQIEKILSEDGVTADGFDKRIRELEGSNEDCTACTRTMTQRLEALEAALKDKVTRGAMRVSDLLIEDTKHEERIATLEAARNDAFRDIEFDRESDRQDRWHATRDAAVQGFCARAGFEALTFNDIDDWSRRVADRAHGPLDGVPYAQLRKSYDEMLDGTVGRHIDALAKAARRVIDAEDRHESRYLADVLDPLEDALQPFEGE